LRVPGEFGTARSGTWLRRDLFVVLRHAAARVACSTGGRPITLGDMSQSDGAIPGTWLLQPRHPPGSHVGGSDIDLAYYQRGRPENHLQAICPHVVDGL